MGGEVVGGPMRFVNPSSHSETLRRSLVKTLWLWYQELDE
jgi:hypothetical protein